MLTALALSVCLQSPLVKPDLDSTVMYEVNLRAFSKQGGFKGVTARLDHLQSLGVNVIWLMPIFPVGKVRSAGGLGSPYAKSSYTMVNPEFGTLADFQALMREARRRKMRVILDWVANHTAWDHPWLKNPSWYTRNEKGEVIIPAGTNWNDVADLNYDSQPMRAAMIDAMTYWVVKQGVDGFRCDFADGVPADFWKSAITKVNAKSPRALLWLAEGARPDHLKSGFDLVWGWPTYGALRDIYAGRKSAQAWTELGLHQKTPMLRYTTNHDESAWDNSAIVNFGGRDAAFGAFVLTALSGGVPLMYTAQELGWAEKIPFFDRSEIDWSSGPDELRRYRVLMQFRATAGKGLVGSVFSNAKVVGFSKVHGGRTTLILVNTSKEAAEILVRAGLKGDWRSVLDSGRTVGVPGDHILKGYQSLVLSRGQ